MRKGSDNHKFDRNQSESKFRSQPTKCAEKKYISKRLANQKKTTEMQLMQKGVAFEKDGFFYFSMGPEIEL